MSESLTMLLVGMIARGLVPVEAMDTPSQGWRENASTAGDWAPAREHRNLARDWIAANDEQWQALLELHREDREERGRQRVGMTSWLEADL